MEHEQSLRALAARLFDAIEAADVKSLTELYTPDALIWTNVTNRTLAARDINAFLPRLAKRLANRRYLDRQVDVIQNGFVQRHRLIGQRNDGAMVSILACVICTVVDGKVTRLEEYCDSVQLKGYMT